MSAPFWTKASARTGPPVAARLPAAARAALALLRANARYWPTVAPRVQVQLEGWRRHAQAIPEPPLRTIALRKLRDERFNAEVAATLATLAAYRRRGLAIDAIVALQVAYDYLDLLTELRTGADMGASEALLEALVDAVRPRAAHTWERSRAQGDDGGYLVALVDTVKGALRLLPGSAAVLEAATASARRCAHAQALTHAPGQALTEPPEALAGAAASVLCLHALIAAAADPMTTPREAQRLDALYRSIGALSMLDSLLDEDEDATSGQPDYLSRYRCAQEMAERLTVVAREAIAAAGELPHGGHHLLTIAGVIAYYASAPAAGEPPASEVLRPLLDELWALLAPTLWTMRTWRAARQLQLVSSLSIGGPPWHSGSLVGDGGGPVRSPGAAHGAPPERMS